jgi:hypothetical protein
VSRWKVGSWSKLLKMCSISPCTFPTKLLLGKVVPQLTEQALP